MQKRKERSFSWSEVRFQSNAATWTKVLGLHSTSQLLNDEGSDETERSCQTLDRLEQQGYAVLPNILSLQGMQATLLDPQARLAYGPRGMHARLDQP
jgi:hypothetical protein